MKITFHLRWRHLLLASVASLAAGCAAIGGPEHGDRSGKSIEQAHEAPDADFLVAAFSERIRLVVAERTNEVVMVPTNEEVVKRLSSAFPSVTILPYKNHRVNASRGSRYVDQVSGRFCRALEVLYYQPSRNQADYVIFEGISPLIGQSTPMKGLLKGQQWRMEAKGASAPFN